MSENRAERLKQLESFAQDYPDEFIRIFDRGQAGDTEMTPETAMPANLTIDQLVAALQGFTAKVSPPAATVSVRKESIKVTPYEGEPELLHRFLADLSSKIRLERWESENEKVVVAESLLAKGKRADKLMDAHRLLGQTTLTTFAEWKQALTMLCEDTGAQEKANRKFHDFHFDRSVHKSFAEFFAEFCVLAGQTSKLDEDKYDQLEMGTPAWLRRLARPIPAKAQRPSWKRLAQHYNEIFIEDDQIKADDNRWKSNVLATNKTVKNQKSNPLKTTPVVPAPRPPSPTPIPAGDPMDIDKIQTHQQATQFVKGKKLNDQIRQICNQFDLCLLCREPGHRIKHCPMSRVTDVRSVDQAEQSKNE